MTKQLNFVQLFSDMFAYLRTYSFGLLPYLVIMVVAISFIDQLVLAAFGDTLGGLVSVLTTIAVSAPFGVLMYRRGLQLDRQGQWISDSWKLGLAQALVYMLFAILLVLIVMFLAVFGGILAGAAGLDPSAVADSFSAGNIREALGGTEVFVLSALIAVSVLALLWVSARLMVFGVATIDEGRLMIFRTWSWTKGAVIKIGLFFMIVMVPALLILGGTVYAVTNSLAAGNNEYGLERWLIESASMAPAQIIVFLLGHAVAVAVYSQIVPEKADYEAAFS